MANRSARRETVASTDQPSHAERRTAAVDATQYPSAQVRSGAKPRRIATWWLVMLELGAFVVAVGFAAGGISRIGCWAVGAVLLLLAVIPTRGRWLIQRLGASATLRGRARSQQALQGLAVAVGHYTVTSVPGKDHNDLGVARTATSATVVIELRSNDLFNADPAFPIGDLAQLLVIEGLPMEAVRLLTWSVPSGRAGAASGEGAAPLCRAVSRYLVLSIGTDQAKDELAARGGGVAGLAQLLRRAALRGCEVLEPLGFNVYPVDPVMLSRLVEASLGPAQLIGAAGSESWQAVSIGPTASTSYSIGGALNDAMDKTSQVIPYLPAALVVTSLALTARAGGSFDATAMLRLSVLGVDGPPPIAEARNAAEALFAQAGLNAIPLDGEHVPALRWTLPLGVAA